MKAAICVWLGFACLFVLTMFPAWTTTLGRMGENYPARTAMLWHAPLWQPPVTGSRLSSISVDYRRMLTEIGVGESFVLALYLTWGRTPPKRVLQPPRVLESKEEIQEDVDGLIAALRQNLRIKVGWDEAKVDRLIAYERERLGNLPLQTLMGAAIERWERDNR